MSNQKPWITHPMNCDCGINHLEGKDEQERALDALVVLASALNQDEPSCASVEGGSVLWNVDWTWSGPTRYRITIEEVPVT